MTTTNFDKRFRFAWWRYVDPYAGFGRFLDLGQRVTQALRLNSLAWDFYYVRLDVREKFEKLVQDRALAEVKSAIAGSLDFYEDAGYSIASSVDRDALERQIFKAFIAAVKRDEGFTAQFADLQLLPVGRKALFYRIWTLWEAQYKYLSQIAFECLKKSAAASGEIDLSAGFGGEEN